MYVCMYVYIYLYVQIYNSLRRQNTRIIKAYRNYNHTEAKIIENIEVNTLNISQKLKPTSIEGTKLY